MKRIEIIGEDASKGVVSIHGTIPRMLMSALAIEHIDYRSILASLGISWSDLDKSNTRISAYVMELIWHAAVNKTGNELFSVNFAEQFVPGSLDGVDTAMAASTNLKSALKRLVKYYKVISSGGELHLDTTAEETRLWLQIPVAPDGAYSPAVDAAITLFLQLTRYIYGQALVPMRVELQRKAPQDTQQFDHFFKCPIHYQSPENVIVFSEFQMTQVLPLANNRLAKANDEAVKEYLANVAQDDVVGRVMSEVIKSISEGNPTQEKIAKKLCMSSRTLQRRLAQSGTNFTDLLSLVRLRLAVQYLNHSKQSVSEIACSLGFSDPSNFARFFKRETGCNPTNYLP